MRAPLFWKEKSLLSTALLPFSLVYAGGAHYRQRLVRSVKLSIPVICVGNLVAGGAGKTPVALKIGTMLKSQGINAHYLSRGYKGIARGPVQVNPSLHTAMDVGDEPLLLAHVLPTWVSKDRLAGAQAAIHAGAGMIIMDDGFQNPQMKKDISLLVIDGHYGLGNERLIPAGPLREPIEQAIERASAVIVIGEDKHQVSRYLPAGKPLLRAHFKPTLAQDTLAGKNLVAFAGIARPRKFHRTLQEMGISPKAMVAFPDHYRFKPKDIAFLRAKAKEEKAILVTTMKDYVRLPADMKNEVIPVPIEAVFDDEAALWKVVLP